jgi:predicted transglutaminase-like cysteine proteinase
VIGHPTGIMSCTDERVGNYYVFYNKAGVLNIAQCDYVDNGLVVKDTKTAAKLNAANTTTPVTFHLKKFRHSVGSPGIVQDLYFVATSLYIKAAPFTGWTVFAAANPAFPLVTNNANTKITMTAQLMIDMTDINTLVNTSHAYAPDWPNDNWRIMLGGETGDCEDFALTKAHDLLDLGYPASALHIEAAMIDGQVFGHAWLVVQTTTGDYALDTSSNTPVLNNQLHPTPPAPGLDVDYVGRRRQIGNNWAFISPYGWLQGAVNQGYGSSGASIWYILDPVLNIFYLIPPLVLRYYPFAQVASKTNATFKSTPSINFSSDNTKIYVAEAGAIKAFTLDQNVLTLLGTTSYTSVGYVGRDGLIQLPVGAYGRQDPYAFGGSYGGMALRKYNDTGFICSIDIARRGAFKSLYGCETISKDGYYEYSYRYLDGHFTGTDDPWLSAGYYSY